ncbi:MAG: DUF4870 domain-containing protein [Puniceicoccales bacterium]
MTTEPTNSSSENTPPPAEPAPTPSGYDPKLIGIVSYITLIGWIVALIMNNPKSEFGSFHIRQSLGIMLLMLISGFIMVVPFIGWILGLVGYLAGFVFWIMGLIGAIQGNTNPVPLIGEKAQGWFEAL